MNNIAKNVAVWLVIALILMTVFNQFSSGPRSTSTVGYSQFLDDVKLGTVSRVTIDGRVLRVEKSDGGRYVVHSPSDPWLVSDLLKAGVAVDAKPEDEPSVLMNIFVSWFPMLLLIGVWIFFMR